MKRGNCARASSGSCGLGAHSLQNLLQSTFQLESFVAKFLSFVLNPNFLLLLYLCIWMQFTFLKLDFLSGYPVRKEVKQGIVQMTFPHVPEEDLEESVLETPSDKPSKKVLPDRMRAARDKANEKIVEFIVKTKGAEEHLQAILKSQKQSRWLKEFLNSSHYVTCVETYLEDEGQLELVVNYLKKVYHETDARNLDLVNGDRIKFILDVLLPEVSK